MNTNSDLIEELKKTASSLEQLATDVEVSKTANVKSAAAVPERSEYVDGVLSALGLED